MDGGDWVATYAAVVATVGLGWQVVTYVLGHRPKVKVRLVLVFLAETMEDSQSLLAGRPTARWQADLRVLNVGRVPAWVDAVAVSRAVGGEAGPMTSWRSEEWELPWVLEPGESREVTVHSDDAGPLAAKDVLTGHAHLASGAHFRSSAIEVGESTSESLVAVSSSSPLGRYMERSGMLRDRSEFRIAVLELLGETVGATDAEENEESAGEL